MAMTPAPCPAPRSYRGAGPAKEATMPDLATHLRAMAAYNRWANRRLYAAAAALLDDDYRRPAGAFFGSLHGTLNHLLVTDRNWTSRLEGTGESQHKPNAILST